MTARYLVRAGLIGALYVALTRALSFMSYHSLQVRVSEALTVLPFLEPAAIPGLVIGCAISNLFGPFGLVDVIVGSSLTLIAAILTSKVRKAWMAPIPPILVNAFGLAFYLPTVTGVPLIGGMPYISTFIAIGVGQGIACYLLGYPLLLFLLRRKGLL